LTLGEIAYKMNYSSVGHLSNQFKKTTSLTPSEFKKMGANRRKSIGII
jgi:AraC family transcriptional regulator